MTRIQAAIGLLHDFDDDSILFDENPLVNGRRQRGAIFRPSEFGRRIALFHATKEARVLTDADFAWTLNAGDGRWNFDVKENDGLRRT